MHGSTAQRIVCPLCHGELRWEELRRDGEEILSARVVCPSCGTTSRVHDGVGYFPPGDAGVAPRNAPVEDAPTPAGWRAALDAARRVLATELREAPGPRLELAFPGFAPGLLPRDEGERSLAAVEGGGPSSAPDPTFGSAPDLAYVEPHSLPIRPRAYGDAILGPGFQDAPGRHIVLREVRRVATGRVMAVAVLDTAPSAPGRIPGWTEAAARELFAKSHLVCRIERVGQITLPGPRLGEFRDHDVAAVVATGPT